MNVEHGICIEMEVLNGTFNTLAQRKAEIGGGMVVWARVDHTKMAGGEIDVSGMKAGDIIPAGTMVKYNGPGKMVEIITADGVAGAAQVETLTLTKGATGSGNIGVTLGGGSVVNIAVTATENTAAKVATKVATGSFSGWTAKAEGDVVTFTCSSVGPKTAGKVDFASTGADGEMAVTKAGVDADGDLTDVNGLTWQDVRIPDGCTVATCAVVTAGRIMADRVAGGGIPASVEKQLPMIEFVREL